MQKVFVLLCAEKKSFHQQSAPQMGLDVCYQRGAVLCWAVDTVVSPLKMYYSFK